MFKLPPSKFSLDGSASKKQNKKYGISSHNIFFRILVVIVIGNLPNELSHHFVNAMKSKKNWEQVDSNPPLFRKELVKTKDKDFVMDSML